VFFRAAISGLEVPFGEDMLALLPKAPQGVNTSQVEKNQWWSLRAGAWPLLRGAVVLGMCWQLGFCSKKGGKVRPVRAVECFCRNRVF